MSIPNINKSILRLAIPNIVTNITVPLLGLVDLALMGHLKDPVYIGAIAFGSIIFNMIYSGFGFLRMGSSGLTAQAWGAKRKDETFLVLIRSLIVAMCLAVIVILFQFPIQWVSFKILNGGEAVNELAQGYFYIRIWAAPATLGLYAFFGWFLGVQNAKTPMIIALVINLVNILMNFVFVLGFGMTSDGVALATVIAQYTGLILAIYFLLTKYKPYVKKYSMKLIMKSDEIIRFFKVNSDIFIRTILLLLTLAFFTNMSAKHGNDILAVNALLFQFFFIFSYFADGFAFAGEALTGKAIGEGNRKLLNSTVKNLFYWGAGAAILASFIYAIGLEPLMNVMTSNSRLLEISKNYSIWVVMIPLTSSAAFIWDGIFIGVTATKAMRNAMIISSLVIFLPAYYLTTNYWGNDALWFALNLFMIARGILMWVIWQRIKNKSLLIYNAKN